jgi:hypothetical protein
MIKKLVVFFMVAAATCAFADEQSDCTAAAGQMLTGVVVKKPVFKHGEKLKGTELSHTLLKLKADADGQVYSVAIDNVFASGYDEAGAAVPAPLDSIAVGDHLEVCGQPFPGGIHWVHTNCGKTPQPDKPNGWVKKLDENGNVSQNFEDNTEYCKLWEKGRGKKTAQHGAQATP